MCGILGFVGHSKNKNMTARLITEILKETQSRGTDATGFYGVENKDKYHYYKMNIPAVNFVNSKEWEEGCLNSYCLIGHNRWTTCGPEINLINNHPHVSTDEKTAVVHNGIIGSFRSVATKNNVILHTECDSEILIRLIEQKEDMIEGINHTFTELNSGFAGFACLAIDNRTEIPYFYAFKNQSYPITFINAFKELGQYFFCSTSEIWRTSVRECGYEQLLSKCEIINLVGNEIWKIDSESMIIEKHVATIKPKCISSTFEDFLQESESRRLKYSEEDNDYPIVKINNENEDNVESSIADFQNIIREIDNSIIELGKTTKYIANLNKKAIKEAIDNIGFKLEGIRDEIEKLDDNVYNYINDDYDD